MASTNKTKQVNGEYYIKLSLSSTPNQAGNYSTVTYKFQFGTDWTGAGYHYKNTNKVVFTLNGTTYVNTSNIGEIDLNGGGWHTLAEGSVKIYHNDDGTKSISYSATFSQTQASGWSATLSGTFALDKIARATVPTLSVTTIKLGEEVTIGTSAANSAYKHTLTYSIGDASGTIGENIVSSAPWIPPKDLAYQFTDSPTGKVTISCATYNGTTLVGTKTEKLTVQPSDDMKPTVSVSVNDAKTMPDGISGYIKGRSAFHIVVDAAAAYGASIKGYSVTANGTTFSAAEVTTGLLVSPGENIIKVTATDTRDVSGVAQETVTVIDYNPPSLSSWSAYRCKSDSDLTEQDDGSYAVVSAAGSITPLEGNARSLRVAYRKVDEPASAAASVDIALDSYDINNSVVIPVDPDFEYAIEIYVGDSFGETAPYTEALSEGFNLLEFLSSNRGLSIGGPATEENAVDINLDLILRKGLRLAEGTTIPIGNGGTGATTAAGAISNLGMTDYVVASGVSGIWYYIKYNSGLAICYTSTVKSGKWTPDTWGSMYCSADVEFGAYPFSFVQEPTYFGNHTNKNNAAWYAYGASTTPKTTAPYINFVRPTTASAQSSLSHRLTVIGRWK